MATTAAGDVGMEAGIERGWWQGQERPLEWNSRRITEEEKEGRRREEKPGVMGLTSAGDALCPADYAGVGTVRRRGDGGDPSWHLLRVSMREWERRRRYRKQQQQPQSPPSLVGAWLCHISSGLREARRGGRAELDDEQSSPKNAAAAGRNKAAREEANNKASSTAVTASCRAGAAMPEAIVCLLLDRFAPS
uniref:Uncharacterized protein n=1 Tax=Oryza meridionalis TaxID=40149 RepID=A0A0E0D3U1_9ORYZ